MDRPNYYKTHTHTYDFQPQPPPSQDSLRTAATYTIYTLLALYAIHQVLVYYDYPLLPPQEILWNALVYLTPQHLLLSRARRQELRANGMLAQTHAAKSDALRRIMGIGGNAVLQNLPGEGIMRRMSGVGGRRPVVGGKVSDAPPGLGNWDNSCYQNSVLQGLASLDSLKEFLGSRAAQGGEGKEGEDDGTTTATLRAFVGRLNDQGNNGRHLWTPAKLKNMSSWQQQDAQEYFSKVMDELDKEATRAAKTKAEKDGLESVVEEHPADQKDGTDGEQIPETTPSKNPLDGLLAQRVACTQCGYSEGLSLIPFNCLTLPLGSHHPSFPLQECLDEYTKLEEISSVECAKCTLLHHKQHLSSALPAPPDFRAVDAEPATNSSALALPPELRAQAFARLARMQQALDSDDFADKTLHESCQIPKKAKVSSSKTRQAVIGRAPRSLVLHVNRSVFDEMTGVQRKNYAAVSWPAELDLAAWTLPTNAREELGATESLLTDTAAVSEGAEQGLVYKVKAVVTHYGRHENGHYICYRRYPARTRVEEELDGVDEDEEDVERKDEGGVEMRWWRLSDEDVSAVSEEEVLKQGGVFMLFYEREQMPSAPERDTRTNAMATESADGAVTSTAPTEPAEDGRLLESETRPAPSTESEDAATAAIAIPEPSPATSSFTETEPPRSTNPTTPASIMTDSTSPFDEEGVSTEAITEDELEPEQPNTPQTQTATKQPSCSAVSHTSPPAPASPPMRTVRAARPESPPGSTKKDGGFGVGVGGSGFRAMATT